MSVHFSSLTNDWATPETLFAELDQEFGFELDVCASPKNAKCRSYFTEDTDGLSQPWQGVCWCNPPYGRTIGKWIQKAYEAAQSGAATVVCLIPARTDTKWWHEFVIKGDETRFVRGRLRFGDADSGAPFPSAIVVFRAKPKRTTRWARGVTTLGLSRPAYQELKK